MLTSLYKIAGYAFVGMIASASLIACAQGSVSKGKLAPKATVCSLYSHAKELNGNLVRLSGIYTTDRFENTTITDSHCPNVWIAPYDATSVDSESLKRFNDAVAGELSDSSLRVFSAEFMGKYVWRPNEKPHGAIYIEKVLSFKRLHDVDPWKQQAKPSK